MLQRVTRYTANGFARVTSIIVFMIALPLSLILALFVLLTGVTAVAIAQTRLHKSRVNVVAQSTDNSTGKPHQSDPLRAPIEGSYTVVNSSPVTKTEQRSRTT